jgi:hypothetical protein
MPAKAFACGTQDGPACFSPVTIVGDEEFGNRMQARLPLIEIVRTLAILCSAAGISNAGLAQTARPWVDPPAQLGSTPQVPAPQPAAPAPATNLAPPAPAPQPQQEAKPESAPQPQPAPEIQTAERETRSENAKTFVLNYLKTWSSPNERALDATAELYAPRVLYHGRTVSLERVFKQKERFVKRWPERDYRPREDAIGSECNPDGTVCKVHTVFDYVAANPRRGRFSQGSGALQLIVQFIGDKPVIVAEHSTVITQSRKRKLASEDVSNE